MYLLYVFIFTKLKYITVFTMDNSRSNTDEIADVLGAVSQV